MRELAAAAVLLTLLASSIQAHEVACGEKAGALCSRWSRNFVDGPVSSGMPDMVGTVSVSLEIDPTGHIAGCMIEQSSGRPAVDAETCRQLRDYAHYRPALDDAGDPTMGSDQLTIEWVFHPRSDEQAPSFEDPGRLPPDDAIPVDPRTVA